MPRSSHSGAIQVPADKSHDLWRWYQEFNPRIWREIELSRTRLNLPSSIQRHGHFVKEFKFDSFDIPPETSLDFPNLSSLEVTASRNSRDYITELVIGHPSMTRLRLTGHRPNPQAAFWDKLLGFHHLKSVTVSNMNLDWKDVDTFWQLCTHLEQLDLSSFEVPHRGNMQSMEFSHIKDFTMRGFRDEGVPLLLEFMRRCPSLTSFGYFDEDGHEFLPGFTELVTARTWLKLHEVFVMSDRITSDEVSTIIQGLQRITRLTVLSAVGLASLDILEHLQPHFCNLKELNMATSSSISSRIAREILTSCPLLERFEGYRINANDVAGRPWVCLRLKVLHLHFSFNAGTVKDLQPQVLDQLSRLIRLEELFMHGFDRRGQESINLTLKNGLGKLLTLRLLRVVDFRGTRQRMNEQEIDWMLEHWRSLECLRGGLNDRKPDVARELRKRLKSHGISDVYREKGRESQ
ncbi:MAG: hypothetical protein J3Q66DRAFT_415870 [Benniella sp.]|nr:MAG: hypothetical protein J3Q66DRAFT_415870 [Benniella sp.]